MNSGEKFCESFQAFVKSETNAHSSINPDRRDDRISAIVEPFNGNESLPSLASRFGFSKSRLWRLEASWNESLASEPQTTPFEPTALHHFESLDNSPDQLRLLWNENELTPQEVFSFLKMAMGRLIFASNFAQSRRPESHFSNYSMSRITALVAEGLELARKMSVDNSVQCRLVVAIMFSHVGMLEQSEGFAHNSAEMFTAWATKWTTMDVAVIEEIYQAIARQSRAAIQEVAMGDARGYFDIGSSQEWDSAGVGSENFSRRLQVLRYRQRLEHNAETARAFQLAHKSLRVVAQLGTTAQLLIALDNLINHGDHKIASPRLLSLASNRRTEIIEGGTVDYLFPGPYAIGLSQIEGCRVINFQMSQDADASPKSIPAVCFTYSSGVSKRTVAFEREPTRTDEHQSDPRHEVSTFIYEGFKKAMLPWMLTAFAEMFYSNRHEFIVGVHALFSVNPQLERFPIIVQDPSLGLQFELWVSRDGVVEDLLSLAELFRPFTRDSLQFENIISSGDQKTAEKKLTASARENIHRSDVATRIVALISRDREPLRIESQHTVSTASGAKLVITKRPIVNEKFVRTVGKVASVEATAGANNLSSFQVALPQQYAMNDPSARLRRRGPYRD